MNQPPHQPALKQIAARAAVALSLLSATAAPLQAQTLSRNIIVLDPAHGGTDTGARLTDKLAEKDFTLSFEQRLRPLLTAAGFTVVSTRDADPSSTLTNDQRAGTANHVHALACLLLHATPSGSGVHISTSTLTPSNSSDSVPWNAAQSPYLYLSLRLANELGVGLLHANIPPLLAHTTVHPIDNLTCPAIALEVAPLTSSGNTTPITDTTYQQRVAQAITTALISWRNHAAPPSKPAIPKPPAPPAATPAQPAAPTSPAGAPR